MAALAATGYGDAAQAAAAQAGINVESLAAIGQIESNFRNVGTANGSTSANGFWQITNGTWNDTVARDGLGGTLDRSNPADQATVASNIIRDTAQTVSNATGQPATTLQVYGGYLFGPSYAGALATEAESTPLSAIIPAASLTNNGMQNLDGRGFSEPDQRQTRTRRESAGADHGRVIYFPNRAGSCGKCAPHAW